MSGQVQVISIRVIVMVTEAGAGNQGIGKVIEAGVQSQDGAWQEQGSALK